jgi:hypothetical protein
MAVKAKARVSRVVSSFFMMLFALVWFGLVLPCGSGV